MYKYWASCVVVVVCSGGLDKLHSFEFHCTDAIEGLLNSQYSRKQLASTIVVSCILELNNMMESEKERKKRLNIRWKENYTNIAPR